MEACVVHKKSWRIFAIPPPLATVLPRRPKKLLGATKKPLPSSSQPPPKPPPCHQMLQPSSSFPILIVAAGLRRSAHGHHLSPRSVAGCYPFHHHRLKEDATVLPLHPDPPFAIARFAIISSPMATAHQCHYWPSFPLPSAASSSSGYRCSLPSSTSHCCSSPSWAPPSTPAMSHHCLLPTALSTSYPSHL